MSMSARNGILAAFLSGLMVLPAQAQSSGETMLSPSSVVNRSATPPAYEADTSKPEANVDVDQSEAANAPVSVETKAQWKAYVEPIQHCTPGDMIIPSISGDVFSHLFNNAAQTNVTLSIQGWQGHACEVHLTEGTHTLACQFNRQQLSDLMGAIIDQDLFDPNSPFAVALPVVCQGAVS